MAKYVKQDLVDGIANVATALSALIGTVTTYWGHSVTKIGADAFLVVVAYDGSS